MSENTSIQEAGNVLSADLLSGSSAGFDRIYKEFAPVLFGYISEIIPDKQAANDMLQQSFTDIWAARHDFDPATQHLFMWMLAITKKNCLTYISKKSKIQNADAFVNNLRSGNDIPDVALGKFVFRLLYLYPYSLKEISGALSIEEAELKKMLRSAVSNLKTLPDE